VSRDGDGLLTPADLRDDFDALEKV